MPANPRSPHRDVGATVRALRGHLGLFSFGNDLPVAESTVRCVAFPELDVRPGGIVECLVSRRGAGGMTSALQIMSRTPQVSGTWALVDLAGECYFPAMPGWGLDPGKTIVLLPATLQDACWAIEQCLRCPGVSATWAWFDKVIPARVHRRWQMAAEKGGGVGFFFRPAQAQREPVWADLRLLVTPQVGGLGETRRVHIEVLYRRGGRGGSTQAWEIDHAAGLVRLVSQVADPATSEREARA